MGSENGTSGAFLRHPSDWVIPNSSEYSAYTSYDISAPVARPSVATAASATVTPGTDMVMCLSCHAAHATDYDYMLRGDYSAMTAGGYADIATATGEGFCLACHTTKGVLPENR
jgi:predicted CXXCH cytochrome family protein